MKRRRSRSFTIERSPEQLGLKPGFDGRQLFVAAWGLSNLDVATLTEFLQEAEKQHGEYERATPKHDWWGWYAAAYIVGRQGGKTPEEAAKESKIHIEAER